jgi:hypothetical protein
MPPRSRRLLIVAASIVAIAVLLIAGYQLAVRQLQSRIEAALGPRASIGSIHAGFAGIDVLDLRVRAAPGWPVEDELRARRVYVQPDLRSLFGGRWRIAKVRIEDGYLSALRSRDGKTHVLPALLEPRAQTPARPAGTPPAPAAAPAVEIARVELDESRLDFFDATVRQPPLRLRAEQVTASASHLVLPALDEPFELKVDGVVKGPQRDGRFALEGRYTASTHDADIALRFSGVDLLALQPYLLKVAETGVKRGALDLDLHATVQHDRLHAPGKLTLSNLELGGGDGPLGTFAGVPRKAVLAAMTDKGKLDVKFVLDGRLDDPSFSLNENLATRIASGLADSLGVSLSGVVKGLGGVVRGLFGQ